MNEHIDPSLLRGLTHRRIGRRDLFKLIGAAGAGTALSACEIQSEKAPPADQARVRKFWAGKKANGHLSFASWPLYMDPKRPELKKFTASTSITVNYQEVIEDDAPWLAKIRPRLAAGKSIGYDLMIMGNGIQFNEMVAQDFLAPLDHARLPNFAEYAAQRFKQEPFDPGNLFSVPYASGMTGIGYNPRYVRNPPTAIADLWDPQYKGRVGMMADTQEIGNFAMLLDGIEPVYSGPDEWEKAADRLRSQREKGIVRKYFDQDYIEPLSRGEVWLSMAWSGDIFQQNVSAGTDLRFVLPEEGATLWTDNMLIPITARNPVDAIMLMDFFYNPEIAATLTEYINFVTPVPSTQNIIRSHAAKASGEEKQTLTEVANSLLVYPSDDDYANLHGYRPFENSREKQQYQSIFEPIVQQ
ncbi:MAG TPA: spermidine/putrescine ABC transporter substrate-binding protein [Streptosporangiaceae bacterium]|nr:spermidine/putrescine ABC transporter substrate-binding protein [Streptosporangiaceae bacterium]